MMTKTFFAHTVVTMNKKCTKCGIDKDSETEFYLCSGVYRTECKKCTIAKNVIYQRKKNEQHSGDKDKIYRRKYMREYYAKNKEKFQVYRDKFSKNHPGYYNQYYKSSKDKKKALENEPQALNTIKKH